MPQFDTSGIGAWRELPFFDADLHRIERDLEGRDFLPRADRVFAALRLTHPDAVRVLILGQDPLSHLRAPQWPGLFHRAGHRAAAGLAGQCLP
jgi:uracil DNA glycosylase